VAVADRIDSDHDTLTIRYEDGGDGWITAQIAEVPAAISQGRTREEARANVISALHDLTHEPTLAERLENRLRYLFTAGRRAFSR
jgi:predicted RNase H-like HicB family nuclease